MKVLIETHGCKLNLADSQQLARELMGAGFEVAAPSESPDVYVLNSCTVTHNADHKARQALATARRKHPGALVVAAGCYVERAESAVAALAGVDLAVNNRAKDALVSRVVERLGSAFATRSQDSFAAVAVTSGIVRQGPLLWRTRAAVKIQEGCDQVCAYCIVPKVRGRERSIPEKEIVAQVNQLAEAGCPEIVLTGTQLGSYGTDLDQGVTSLIQLVRRILIETPVQRLRISSLQPLEVRDELLALWSGVGKGRLCPHFHLPLQSGSDSILKQMRRRYDSASFEATVARVRAAVPGCSVTTDVIAGFPGETELDHRSTVSLMNRVRFADAHVFPYSRRPGTSAYHFGGLVDSKVRSERAAELRALASEHGAEHRGRFVGTVRPVVWERGSRHYGLTDNYLRVRMAEVSRKEAAGLASNLAEDVLLAAVDGEVLVGVPVMAQ
jgi:threonylcarbamoyladenosine tRNA methylthiotransferase MtaB